MHQISFSGFDSEFDDDRPTWPPPGTSDIIIEDKFEPLFTSATWTITATVNGDVISRSQIGRAHV